MAEIVQTESRKGLILSIFSIAEYFRFILLLAITCILSLYQSISKLRRL